MKKIAILAICFLVGAVGLTQSITAIDEHEITIKSSFLDPPSQFDLRDVNGENYVTGIRDQGPYGTCWCHGVMAAMEGNLLMTGNWDAAGETGEPDLSEAHLDWWNGFNTYNNDDDPGGGGLDPHYGGDYLVASAYIIRGDGAVRESDAPYSQLTNPCPRDDPAFHHYYPYNVEWYVAAPDLSNIDVIKNQLMTHGVIGTAMCFDYSFLQNMGGYYAHYQPPSSSQDPNHAIAICGWDDSKVTTAPEPGAWLCKNSWGYWGPESGFFWISYYDKCCGQHPEMGAVSFQYAEYEPFDTIYYHDYHGWRDTLPEISEAFNVFTPQSNEILIAASFFTAENDCDYELKIYDEYEGGQLSDLLTQQTGSIDYYGYHTIELNSPIGLTVGNDVYIYVKLSSGGHPIDRTSDVPVLLGSDSRTIVKSTANPGESFYKSGSTWYDLYDYQFPDPTWDETANFCIKVLTGIPTAIPDLHCTGSLVWNEVPPGSTQQGTLTIENVGDPGSLLGWEIESYPIWGDWSFNPENGNDLTPEEGAITVEVSVDAPHKNDATFTGEIIVVNSANPSDNDTISVTLVTPVQTSNFLTQFPIINYLFELYQNYNGIFTSLFKKMIS